MVCIAMKHAKIIIRFFILSGFIRVIHRGNYITRVSGSKPFARTHILLGSRRGFLFIRTNNHTKEHNEQGGNNRQHGDSIEQTRPYSQKEQTEVYNKQSLATLRRNRTGVRLFHSSDYRKNTNIYRNPSPNFCKQFIKDQKLPPAYPLPSTLCPVLY